MQRERDGRKPRGDEVELTTRELRVEQKRFYFNLKENGRGRFLKIAEVSGGRSTIIIPVSGWREFRDLLDEFIDAESATEGIVET
ncbi:MAG: PUR family DNA/RNA-binding protein [Deltaproteobacteria bacterium]|nr:PUR family DNA/RNA-binding protein [Deltaproteobacteria bacterium]